MVTFKDITFDKDWVYAEAYIHITGETVNVKVHRRKEKLEYSPKPADIVYEHELIWASWHLAMAVEKGSIKMHGSTTIAWG